MKHKHPLNISSINGSINQTAKSTNFISNKDSKNTISSNSKDLDNYLLRTSFENK